MIIINVQDKVVGSWHQITVEKAPNAAADGFLVRLDGTALPYDNETARRAKALLGAFEDDFEGITDKTAYLTGEY